MGGTLLVAPWVSGCIRDPDCGVCDPNRLDLVLLSGPNYSGASVHRVAPPCEGPRCPAPFDRAHYFVDEVVDCLETPAALASPDPEEYCRISPLVATHGIEFVFNNLLDPTSVEQARRKPDNPQLFEIYAWHPDIARIVGPMTRYRGDYVDGDRGTGDRVTRLVNLSCADAVPGFHEGLLDDPATNPCNRMNGAVPAKMEVAGEFTAATGRRSAFSTAQSCSTPTEGPDTCCTSCEWLLSTRIARYGLLAPHVPPPETIEARSAPAWPREAERNPNVGSALTCGSGVPDKFRDCAAFEPAVDRRDESRTWFYRWNCPPGASDEELRASAHPCYVHPLPLYDRLRELHPDRRPTAADVERGAYERTEDRSVACTRTSECTDVHGLPGTECIGTHVAGGACLVEASLYAEDGSEPGACTAGECRPEWFVACRADRDTTGTAPLCVDRRFEPRGSAACWDATTDFAVATTCGVPPGPGAPLAPAGTPLGVLDCDRSGSLSASEACQAALGGDGTCDPYLQPNVQPRPRYGRNPALPSATRDCVCAPLENVDAACREVVREGCYDGDRYLVARHGQYAVDFVTGNGGVIYDPALKGIQWLPADRGNVPRAEIEQCAERSGSRLVGPTNHRDGWLAHREASGETMDDFDRALCSGQTYVVEFTEPEAGSHVRDKNGNTLAGKSRYRFETPQFHVVPNSGVPGDTLRIGACDAFQLGFSNKYDLDPENLRKLQLVRIDPVTSQPIPPSDDCPIVAPAAGGPECAASQDELEARIEAGDVCAAPCLTVDVSEHQNGRVRVWIDTAAFELRLQQQTRYRLVAPAVDTLAQAVADPELYRAAFWDACGMPLVRERAVPYEYDFTIDPPRCSDDEDRDGLSNTCDNARAVYNPDQGDIDLDGVGDVYDLCPLVPSSRNNTADSDKDGVGNECDNCRRAKETYHVTSLPLRYAVRNIPHQGDADRDGIGDVCDNCVQVANCEDYGPRRPHRLGDPIADTNTAICQGDDDRDMLGNACQGQTTTDIAAGPVGWGADDDFDQDGLRNAVDACPRQPLDDAIACTSDDDCPTARRCVPRSADTEGDGLCNHTDTDEDEVGDICDTCPEHANGGQIIDGLAEEDDPDGNFVGRICESTLASCPTGSPRPRPFGFYPVRALGNCCTVELVADDAGDLWFAREYVDGLQRPLMAPHRTDPRRRVPVRLGCTPDQESAGLCLALPATLVDRPGILRPPTGCDEAFAAHDTIRDPLENLAARHREESFSTLDALWRTQCFLPQRDHDFDGLDDACDLCPYDFDPENTRYRDETGQVDERRGRYCNGDYSPNARCADDGSGDTEGDTDGGLDTDVDGSGGTSN